MKLAARTAAATVSMFTSASVRVLVRLRLPRGRLALGIERESHFARHDVAIRADGAPSQDVLARLKAREDGRNVLRCIAGRCDLLLVAASRAMVSAVTRVGSLK